MLIDSIGKSSNRSQNAGAAGFTVTPGRGAGRLNGTRMIWLALPLILAVGCASDPSRSAWTDQSYTKFPAPITTPVTSRQIANVALGQKMFELLLTLTNADCTLSAVSSNGVVTLGGSSFTGGERQVLVDQVWAQTGVKEVENDEGDDLTETVVTNAVVVR
jgi:hypothetical protein